MKGPKSMVWYCIILVIALLVSMYFLRQFITDPNIKSIYM